MGLIDISENLIPFVTSFGFEVQVSKLENTNSGITPRPFVRFVYNGGEDYDGMKLPLVIYRDETYEEVCDKIRDALIKVGNTNRDIEIKKLLFDD